MCELAYLQIDEDMTLQNTVVEDEVQIEVLILISHHLLSGNEAETTAKLKKEFLKFVDESLFQIRFMKRWIILQIQKLQDVGIPESGKSSISLCKLPIFRS